MPAHQPCAGPGDKLAIVTSAAAEGSGHAAAIASAACCCAECGAGGSPLEAALPQAPARRGEHKRAEPGALQGKNQCMTSQNFGRKTSTVPD